MECVIKHLKPLLGVPWTAAVSVVVGGVVAVAYLRRVCRNKRRRPRAPSIGTSSFIAKGVHPPEVVSRSIINCVGVLHPLPSVDAVHLAATEHVIPHLRFHSVPKVAPDGSVDWISVKVDVRDHVRTHITSNFAEAQQLVDTIACLPLHSGDCPPVGGRPWWEVHLISIEGDGRGIVIARVSHAVGDGVSLLQIFAPLLKDATGRRLHFSSLFSPARGTTKRSFNPLRMMTVAADFAHKFVKALALGAVGSDTVTALTQPRDSLKEREWVRRTVFLPVHSMELVKAIKNNAGSGTTVNDVEYSVLSGAIHRYLRATDARCAVETVHIRALTAVSLPDAAPPELFYYCTARNLFALLSTDMPVSSPDSLSRLQKTKSIWARIKNSMSLPAAFAVHRFGATLPLSVQRQAAVDVFMRHTLVFSNVPGPQEEVYVCGSRIDAIYAVLPNVIPQVCLLSLTGKIHGCMNLDDRHGGGAPEVFRKCFRDELVALARATRVAEDVIQRGVHCESGAAAPEAMFEMLPGKLRNEQK